MGHTQELSCTGTLENTRVIDEAFIGKVRVLVTVGQRYGFKR